MNIEIVKRQSIIMAAKLATGDPLSKLLERCENQKRVSSEVIEKDLDEIHEYMKLCSIQMRKLYDLV